MNTLTKKVRILAIDDYPPYYEMFKMYLEEHNEPFEIIEIIDNGEDGLKAINSIGIKNIDLICLDLQMSGMDGDNFIKYFKKQFGTSNVGKIQILSNYTSEEIIQNISMPLGITLIPLSKKATLEELVYSLKNNTGLSKRTIDDIKNILSKMNISIDTDLLQDKYLVEYCLYISRHYVNIKARGERAKIWEAIAMACGTAQDNVRMNVAKKLQKSGLRIEIFTEEFQKNLSTILDK